MPEKANVNTEGIQSGEEVEGAVKTERDSPELEVNGAKTQEDEGAAGQTPLGAETKQNWRGGAKLRLPF